MHYFKANKKSGGGGQEDPNTLQNKSRLRLLGLISEGPIEGFVDEDPAKNILINDVPLKDSNNELNYEGVSYTYRYGLPDQDHIPGFLAGSTLISLGDTEVKTTTPYTFTVSGNYDAAIVSVAIPALFDARDDKKGVKKTSVSFAIDVKTASGSYVTVHNKNYINEKCVSRYEEDFRVDLPRGGGPWSIRVRRITPDAPSNTDKLQNSILVARYQPIVDGKFNYRNRAIFGVEINAELFGANNPKFSVYARGIKCWVPKNYNPITRVYSTTGPGTTNGTWDGTFKMAWTNNPAWVLFDMLTNNRYGLGKDFWKLVNPNQLINGPDDALIDKWQLYVISQHCDELVPNGYGGTEPRYTINVQIKDRADAFRLLSSVVSTFRGMMYYADGRVVFTVDKDEDPSFQFTQANVEDGLFNYSSSSQKVLYSVAAVRWKDNQNFGKEEVELYEDYDLIRKIGQKITTVDAFGCTSRSLARRIAKWTLLTEKTQGEIVSFNTGIEGANLTPGVIISVLDPYKAGARAGGRIQSISTTGSSTTFTVDKFVSTGTNPKFTYLNTQGKPVTVNIASSSSISNTYTINSVISDFIGVDSVFVISWNDLKPQLYRVIGVKEDNEKGVYSVAALKHDPSKYAAIEQNLSFEERPTSLISSSKPTPPLSVEVTKWTSPVLGSEADSKITVSWTPPKSNESFNYELQLETSTEPFSTVFTGPEVTWTSGKLPSTVDEDFRVRVRSIDTLGRVSSWRLSNVFSLEGDVSVPESPNVLPPVTDQKTTELRWVNPNVPDYKHTEIFVNTVDNFSTSAKIAETTGNTYTYVHTDLNPKYFWIVSVTNSLVNNKSNASTSVYVTPSAAPNGVEIVSTLPTSGNFEGRIVFLTTDDKLYRFTGSAWTAAVNSSDLTGQLTDSQIASIAAAKITGQLTSAQIQDGSISGTKFASGLQPITVVSSVPSTLSTSTIFNTSDGKLYRWNGSSYVASVPTSDLSGQILDSQISGLATSKLSGLITNAQIQGLDSNKLVGQITNAQIAALEAGKITGQLSDSQIAALQATKITGQLTNAQIAALDAAKLVGQLTAAQIADGAVTSSKFGTNLRPVEIVSTLPTTGNFEGRVVFLTTDDKLYRHNGTSWSSAVPSTDISGQITDAQIAGLAAGKVTGQLTNTQIADIAAAKITGQITTVQITDNAISAPKIAAGAVVAGKIAADAVTASEIAAGAITTAKIAAGAVTAAQIAANTITASQIAAGTITASQLAANSVTASQLATDSVTANKIAAGAITAGKIAANAVTASEIAAGSVTTAKIVAGAVTANEIASNAITSDKIAANAVTAGKIVAGSVTANELATNAVTSDKINANAVTAAKIAANTITAAQIASGTITSVQIAAGTITAAQIAAETIGAGQIAAGAVTAIKIATNAITADKIDANAVTTGKIAAGAVTAAQIAAGAVTAGKIAADSVTALEIAASAITASELAANSVVSDKIAANAITAGKIAAGVITANELASNSVTADKILAGAVTAAKITSNAITSDKLAANAITGREFSASESFTVGSGNNVFVMSGKDPNLVAWAGSLAPGTANFKVGKDGTLTARSILVTDSDGTILLDSSIPGLATPAFLNRTNATVKQRSNTVSQGIKGSNNSTVSQTMTAVLDQQSSVQVSMSFPVDLVSQISSINVPSQVRVRVLERYRPNGGSWTGYSQVLANTFTRINGHFFINGVPTNQAGWANPALPMPTPNANQYRVIRQQDIYFEDFWNGNQYIFNEYEYVDAPSTTLSFTVGATTKAAGTYEYQVIFDDAGSTVYGFNDWTATVTLVDTDGTADFIIGEAAPTGSGGSPGQFIFLTDTPTTYAGNAGSIVRVNPTANGLDFINQNTLSIGWNQLTNVPSRLTVNSLGALNTRIDSGFYDGNASGINWPNSDSNWQHLIASTHGNTANYFSMQLAGSFFDQELYVRKTNNNAAQAWSRVWTSSNFNPDSINAQSLGGFSAGSATSGFAANSIPVRDSSGWLNERVIRNNASGSDGLYIGYANVNNGWTRLYGGGSTSDHSYVQSDGILRFSNGGMPYVISGFNLVNRETSFYNITSSTNVWNAAIQVREVNQVGTAQTGNAWAPGILFHWGARHAAMIGLSTSNDFCFWAQDGNKGIGSNTASDYVPIRARSATFTESITVSSSNATGGGIILADDGDLVDLNNGYLNIRFTNGIQVHSANKGGVPNYTIFYDGAVNQRGSYTLTPFGYRTEHSETWPTHSNRVRTNYSWTTGAGNLFYQGATGNADNSVMPASLFTSGGSSYQLGIYFGSGHNSGNSLSDWTAFIPASTSAEAAFRVGVRVNSGNNNILLTGDGSIEIQRAGGGAYIDFKDSISEDYDVRIQQNATNLDISSPWLGVGTGLHSAGGSSKRWWIGTDSSGNFFFNRHNNSTGVFELTQLYLKNDNVSEVRGQLDVSGTDNVTRAWIRGSDGYIGSSWHYFPGGVGLYGPTGHYFFLASASTDPYWYVRGGNGTDAGGVVFQRGTDGANLGVIRFTTAGTIGFQNANQAWRFRTLADGTAFLASNANSGHVRTVFAVSDGEYSWSLGGSSIRGNLNTDGLSGVYRTVENSSTDRTTNVPITGNWGWTMNFTGGDGSWGPQFWYADWAEGSRQFWIRMRRGGAGVSSWNNVMLGTTNTWHVDSSGLDRYYYEANGRTYYKSNNGHEFRHSNDSALAIITPDGHFSTLQSTARMNWDGAGSSGYCFESNGNAALRGISPTFFFRDRDASRTAALHLNGDLFYILRHGSADTNDWDSGPNNRHPMTMNISNGDVVFSGNVGAFSDIKFKTDICDLSSESLRLLKPRSFVMDGSRQVGFVAQEVLKVEELSHLVYNTGNALALNYAKLTAPLVAGWQNHERKIKELENKIEKLLSKLEAMGIG